LKLERGLFITFEGIEGSGKSTQIELFCQFLKDSGIEYVRTLEPGGTLIGNEIRKILLSVEHSGMTALTELLLYAAARAQHVGELIGPSLDRGQVVVCDRFGDSTMAYQGFGRGIERDLVTKLNDMCTGGITPDLTFLLDVDVETGLKRNRKAHKIDRIELETADFHKKVREGYHFIAESDPGRVRVIGSGRQIAEVAGDIRKNFDIFIKAKGYVIR
jgi:dTMP kinase